MRDLPSGTVTLLFTDIEGSTRLLHELGDGYTKLLADHRTALRAAFSEHGGIEVDTQGDAFFYAFPRATDAIAAATEGQKALDGGRIQVRMGIHTGEPMLTDEGYVGVDVHRAARVMAAGHGGQVLVSAATAQMIETDGLRDLGEHRLKDMIAPQRLYQLGERDFPPIRTLDATNLPVTTSALLGREREVEELLALLTDGARLVTITGPGGIGKTRLALQVASELVGRFRDGVFWVPLAQLTDPDLVLPEIGKQIGQDPTAHLRAKETLLLLDNTEQLDVAPQLAELLAAAPKCTLLVTTRAPLHLTAEREYPLDPLSQDAAVTLFVERARAVGSRVEASEAVIGICRQLDALPLAIELAAARTKLMDPVALRQRLDRRLPILTGGPRDAPERQRTLRATIEWSHDLLETDARRIFMRLSVFTGGCTLEAAEAVCDADLDALGALVDMSLLKVVDGGRFLMLETLREYASDRLEESGEGHDLALRHASFYADLVERLDEDRRRPGHGPRAMTQMDGERANIHAAAVWAGAAGEPAVQVRLLSANRDMFLRGSHSWLRAQLENALAAGLSDSALLTRAEATLAFTAYRQGDLVVADRAARRSLALAEQDGDARLIAVAHNYISSVENSHGRFAEARTHLELAVESSRAAGDVTGVATGLVNLSDVALSAGEFELARTLALQAREVIGPEGDPGLVQVAAANAATAQVRLGELDEAEALTREAVAIARPLDDVPVLESCLRLLAAVAAGRADWPRAAQMMGLSERMRTGLDATLEPSEQALDDWVMDELRTRLPKTLAAEMAAGRELSLDAALEG